MKPEQVEALHSDFLRHSLVVHLGACVTPPEYFIYLIETIKKMRSTFDKVFRAQTY